MVQRTDEDRSAEPTDDAMFAPITRETVSSQIRAQLLERITSGELAPGARVPSERDLSDQFQVARTSVREAMQGLVSLGVIERRGNRAYVVEHLPEVIVGGDDHRKGFVRQLFETRRLLEVPIFSLAAERAGADDRRHITELAGQFSAELDLEAFRTLDRRFHTTVAAACGNDLLIELYGKVLDRLFRSDAFHSLLSADANRAEVDRIVAQSATDHRAIAHAIATGDVDAVRRCAESHLTNVEHRMVDHLV